MSFEQCAFIAFETNAPNITYNFSNGSCICTDAAASLSISNTPNTAFTNQCSSFNTTNTIEINNQNQYSIYPNPSQSVVFLKNEHFANNDLDELRLFSSIGHQLLTTKINSSLTKIDLTQYPKGVYILIATINGTSKTFKVVKEEKKPHQMNKLLIQIIVYLIISVNGFGQNKFIITIDEACFQSAETKLIDGTFGLYGDIQTSSYPFWQRDTLIEVLEFKPEQEIYLESRSYTLRFIPNDSTQKAHYVHIHPQNKSVNLSCFFFNKPVPLALKTMKNNDYLKLVSRYAGPTNMETIIPIYSLVIVKKRGHYFAAFRETSGNEQDLLMLNLAIGPHEQKRIKVRKDFIKLTEDQVKKIEAFWSTMAMYWYDQDHSSFPSLTSIHDQTGQLTFPSNEYVSCLLWNQLN